MSGVDKQEISFSVQIAQQIVKLCAGIALTFLFISASVWLIVDSLPA